MAKRLKGETLNEFLDRHIPHHIRDHRMSPSVAKRAALEEARSLGFKVPKKPRKSRRKRR